MTVALVCAGKSQVVGTSGHGLFVFLFHLALPPVAHAQKSIRTTTAQATHRTGADIKLSLASSSV